MSQTTPALPRRRGRSLAIAAVGLAVWAAPTVASAQTADPYTAPPDGRGLVVIQSAPESVVVADVSRTNTPTAVQPRAVPQAPQAPQAVRSAPSEGTLPVTGGDVAGLAVVGAGLAGLGAAMLVARRRAAPATS